jgi:MoxR-like ATPase
VTVAPDSYSSPGSAAGAQSARRFADLFDALTSNMARVIRGKREAIDLAAICLLAEGHLLVEDVPGVGKTSLAKALANSIDCDWRRVQFTPDLLPTDLVGVNIWLKAQERFEFQPGPVFANILLADEINRASPKVQSALLEAMEERQVTVDGRTYPLPAPFMVIATQNPVEQEGTYRLPESQLDRFLLRISIGYPGREAEVAILDTHGQGNVVSELRPVLSVNDVVGMVEAVKTVHLAPALKHYLVAIAEATRRHPSLALGLSPRATLQLARASRARAAASGRDYATPDDVKAMAPHVLPHRLMLRHEASAAGQSRENVALDVLNTVPVPTAR